MSEQVVATMDPGAWAWLVFWGYAGIVCAVGLIALSIGFGLWYFWVTPKSARNQTYAKRKGAAMMGLASDDGGIDLEFVYKLGSEGAAETKGKGKNKQHWSGFLPQTTTPIDSIQVGDGMDEALTLKIANYIRELSQKKLFLRDAKVAFWVGYKGKAILTNLLSLAGIAITEELMEKLPEKFKAVDITAIKRLFSNSWNESQINAQEEDKIREGRAEAKQFMSGKEWLWPIVILGFCFGAAAIFIVVAKMAGIV